jgi:hypothetical protein
MGFGDTVRFGIGQNEHYRKIGQQVVQRADVR